MTETKRFPTVAVMGLYTGVLLIDGGFRDIMRVADFLVGEPVYLHDMGRVAEEVRPYLLDWFPWFEDAKADWNESHDYAAIAKAYTEQYGDMLELQLIPQDDHTSLDPIASMRLLGIPDEQILCLYDDDAEDKS